MSSQIPTKGAKYLRRRRSVEGRHSYAARQAAASERAGHDAATAAAEALIRHAVFIESQRRHAAVPPFIFH